MNVIIFAAIVAVIIIIGGFISISNKIERCKVKITESESGIDVALTKRYDTLVKLRDIVAEYTSHENSIVLESISLRSGMSLSEKIGADQLMRQAGQQLQMLAESYPILQSQHLYVDLQRTVADVEEHLQAARRLYNSNVSMYNQLIVVFPNSMVARMKAATDAPMYRVEEHKREDINFKDFTK